MSNNKSYNPKLLNFNHKQSKWESKQTSATSKNKVLIASNKNCQRTKEESMMSYRWIEPILRKLKWTRLSNTEHIRNVSQQNWYKCSYRIISIENWWKQNAITGYRLSTGCINDPNTEPVMSNHKFYNLKMSQRETKSINKTLKRAIYALDTDRPI